jgi:hypothetical protein
MRDQLFLQDLTDQIGTLTGRILEKLIKTPEERALWGKTERFYLAKKILLLQATPTDLRTYKDEKILIEPELAGVGLLEVFAVSIDFYNTVEKRDEIFFSRIMNDPSLAGNVAIVTGGFHTEGLSKRFRDAGISYVTITPELSGMVMNEKLYNERMKETRKTGNEERIMKALPKDRSLAGAPISDQTLSELRNIIVWIDKKFFESYEALHRTKKLETAISVFMGKPVTLPGSAKISHLPREGRIAPVPKAKTAVNVSKLRASEFMAKPRVEQLEIVRDWLAQGPKRQEKAMLVSSASILSGILLEKKAVKLLEEAVSNGDIIALARDIPLIKMPEIFSSMRGIHQFEAANIAILLEKTPNFQRLAKKHPFAIMENDRPSGTYVVLPEKTVSLVLFRIITLNPSLYQAAKNPAFLALLQNLVAEILSQELPKTSA